MNPNRAGSSDFPYRPDSMILLTSYFWEGSVILKGLIDANVGLSHLVIQRPWWGERSFRRSRARFVLNTIRYNIGRVQRRYHSLECLARRAGLAITYIDNINESALQWDAERIRLIVVAGSRILKPPVVAKFHHKIVNFHSGLLPYYRGPYSEFWAMYEQRPDMIGSSVHLIDEGVDTGPLLATQVAQIPDHGVTPQEAHYLNVLQAIPMISATVTAYVNGDLTAQPQPPGGRTYTYPSPADLAQMVQRVGRTFRVNFIE